MIRRIFGRKQRQQCLTPEVFRCRMDLICNSYSDSSEDDQNPKPVPVPKPKPKPEPDYPLPKRIKTHPTPHREAPAPVAGRYVSKRERALLGSFPPPATPEKPLPSAAKCIGNFLLTIPLLVIDSFSSCFIFFNSSSCQSSILLS